MITIVSIVEGDGEVRAFPLLLRRISSWLTPQTVVHVDSPIRVRRDQFLNREELFSKHLLIAAKRCVEPGWIVILLDADDDCPQRLGADILAKARSVVPHRAISVVLANREYEAWFIASANALDGKRGFKPPKDVPDPEAVRGAKQWLSRQIAQGAYHEVIDQPAFSALIDLDVTHANSRSFRKLCSDWIKFNELLQQQTNQAI